MYLDSWVIADEFRIPVQYHEKMGSEWLCHIAKSVVLVVSMTLQ